MRIVKLNLEHLQNEEWYTYQTFLIKLIKKTNSLIAALAALLILLEKNGVDAVTALEIIRKSKLSEPIAEADALRKQLIKGLNSHVAAFLHNANPDKQRAAKNLKIVINHYKSISKASQDQQSGMIINFIKELDENHTADMATIGLEERKEQLKTTNEEFIALLDQRTAEIGSKTTLRMPDIRREGNRIIRHIFSQIEILLLSTPDDTELIQFANELNAENRRVKGNLHRKGKNKKDTSENSETETEATLNK